VRLPRVSWVMGISENQRPFGRTRFPLYLRNQLSYWKKDATIGFSTSNRYNYDLERRSNGRWGRLGRWSKKREIGMIGGRFWIYRNSQQRWPEMNGASRFTASNRCNHPLALDSNCSWGHFVGGLKKRDRRTHFHGYLLSQGSYA